MRAVVTVALSGMFLAMSALHAAPAPTPAERETTSNTEPVPDFVREYIADHTVPMPTFARKYKLSCNVCHTTIPELNEFGYKFRARGFRLPGTVGKEDDQPFELGNAFSGRIQSRWDFQSTNQPNGVPIPNCPGGVCGDRTTTAALSFMEATLYPLTTSWGKYFASESELSVSPEDFFEVENGYVRFVKGNDDNFFTGRIGILHSWEGFGASDRPVSNGRPLFQTSPISASGRGVPYLFQPWGLDEVGLEVGADFSKLSLRAAMLSGTFMRWDEEANTFLAFPAQTGPWKGANQAVAALGKPVFAVGHNIPDFSANLTYLLHSEGGGLSLIYYHGNIATPTHCASGVAIGQTDPLAGLCGVSSAGVVGDVDFDYTAATAFENDFDRVAAYASYPVGKFLPRVGGTLGRDHTPVDPAAFPTGGLQTFTSKGAFADGSLRVSDYVTAGVRYDWFHPNTTKQNTQWAVTPYLNVPLNDGFQLIAEFQHRDFQLDATHNRQNDVVQVRVIFIQ